MSGTMINYREISPELVTGGIPDREMLLSLRQLGFGAVISLTLPNSQPTPEPDECQLVTGQGLIFVQIPVRFDNPRLEEFEFFCTVMDQLKHTRVLVHCAMNYRVSSFVYLYRIKAGLADEKVARAELDSVWQPDDVWSDFIEEVLEA